MSDEALLVVTSGVQSGATIRLPHGESLVGSDPACAVVVADEALDGRHLRIAVADAVQIRADCRIVLSDGAIVEPGDVFEVASACSFTAGSTTFRLELPRKEPVPTKAIQARRWRSLLPLPVGTVIIASAALIGVLALYNGAEERSFAATLSSHQTLSDAPPADLAAAFLRQQAGEAGLTELVVTPRTDGAVMIGGVLGQAQQRDWSAVRQKFDQRFGTERVLVEQFDAAAFIPSVHVAAVWSGANPYMVDDHGNRLRPGASLGDGWSIQSIDSQNVTVRQGPRTVALRY